ncbi:LytR/AlgR family response regulator transcription factor [Sunxiuqinia elliptica]|uniref:Two component transcriptional regulator, LytTR family n=1 Tax=Sunxiuqinia elliptica TaxID=655355 RepID=A0A1I2CYX4_9BACT|nr:LytTR family DNA-binding domain-containing protein [Sunxiuqinia elliptica]SFE73527.1 two component transcriptional regulator, LytTR family [Sunxiuqinia elliptica]
MYRAAIIDDDQLARRVLFRILDQHFPNIEIVGEASSVESGIDLITKESPDLVFLDIEMPDGTGFDLIERLPEVNFKLVFTTSYSDYAITAFKYSAFDYILKPVLVENVKATIQRIGEIPVLNEKHRIEVLKNSLEKKDESSHVTIALPEMNGFAIIKVSNIIRCEGERNYTRVFYLNGTSVLISRTLLEFDQLLVPHGFCRIHRSHLVNLKYVDRYLKTDGGLVELSDKSQLRVSPKYKEELLDKLLHNRL